MASIISIIVVFLLSLISLSQSQQTCSTQKFTNNKLYTKCSDLPSLKSTLHWAYDPLNFTLQIAFTSQAPPNGWISWAINPKSTGMIGAQSLIAFRGSTGKMGVKTYDISDYDKVVESTRLWFEVRDTSAEFEGGVMRLFATVVLPEKVGSVNHVWQVGPGVTGGVPDKHGFGLENMNAKGRLDLLSGVSTSGGGGSSDSRLKKKNIHGILNAISWGILFPIGIVIARYLRTFDSADPAWFYLHVSCQCSAYVIGVAGWATGLKLGSESKGVQYSGHRNIGIALFTLATVQVFALLLRPKKDHKYRFYWNIYHHGVGYVILILGVLNVFKGLDILSPATKWRSAYIVILAAVGVLALLLEISTWIVVLRRKGKKSTKTCDGFDNGQGRQQPLAT